MNTYSFVHKQYFHRDKKKLFHKNNKNTQKNLLIHVNDNDGSDTYLPDETLDASFTFFSFVSVVSILFHFILYTLLYDVDMISGITTHGRGHSFQLNILLSLLLHFTLNTLPT